MREMSKECSISKRNNKTDKLKKKIFEKEVNSTQINLSQKEEGMCGDI